MKKYLSLLLICFVLQGCAHCSKTVTTFDGKTKGFNPYGDGDLTIDRTAYWGTKGCVGRLLDQEEDQ